MTITCDQCGKSQEYDGSGLCSWRSCAETGSCDGRQLVRVTDFYDAIEPLKQEIARLATELYPYTEAAKFTQESIQVNVDCGCHIVIMAQVNKTGWIDLKRDGSIAVTIERCQKHTG